MPVLFVIENHLVAPFFLFFISHTTVDYPFLSLYFGNEFLLGLVKKRTFACQPF